MKRASPHSKCVDYEDFNDLLIALSRMYKMLLLQQCYDSHQHAAHLKTNPSISQCVCMCVKPQSFNFFMPLGFG